MNPRKAGCILAAFLLASVPMLAQGTYTQIDVPGATNTVLYGIDTAGDIVGFYEDTNGLQHGFILSGGSYTTIDYPGAANTVLFNINDKSQIVGSTDSAPYIGFSYNLATQLFTVISVPRPQTVTYPFAINNAGAIAGGFYNGDGAFGFEFAGSTYRKIRPLDASDAFAYGITDSGKLAGHGTSRKLGTIVNFLFRHGIYSPMNIPNAPEAQVYGMNLAGTTLVGFYTLPSGDQVGFSFQSGTTQELDFPGTVSTVALGANNAGEVVGYFYDGANSHGFTWTPPGNAAKK